MDMSEYRPRVNGAMLSNNLGRGVVIIGVAHDVHQDGSSFNLKTCDGMEVLVKLNEKLQEYVNGLVEVHGVVDAKDRVTCHQYIQFGEENTKSFNMKNYNRALQLVANNPTHYITGSA